MDEDGDAPAGITSSGVKRGDDGAIKFPTGFTPYAFNGAVDKLSYFNVGNHFYCRVCCNGRAYSLGLAAAAAA